MRHEEAAAKLVFQGGIGGDGAQRHVGESDLRFTIEGRNEIIL